MASKAAQVDFLIAGMLKADATINSAGTVEFFQAQSGTWATPKNAFEEAAKSTPITTLTLDAAGKGTAFCDGVYDIRIKDSDGNTVDSLLEVNFSRLDTQGVFNIEVITGSSNVVLDGDEDIVIVNTTSSISVTLASSATADGRKIIVKTIHAATGTITVKATAPDTIDGVVGATGIALSNQYESLEVIADSSNTTYHLTYNGTLIVDTINERTAASGVTVDGFKIKDNAPDPTSWPSFHAHRNGNDQLNITGSDQIEFNDDSTAPAFDTNSDYNTTTFRFTPTVAGKYLLHAQLVWDNVVTNDNLLLSIFKNGSEAVRNPIRTPTDTNWSQQITAILDANGSTDYFDVRAQNLQRDTSDVEGETPRTYFCGSRIA